MVPFSPVLAVLLALGPASTWAADESSAPETLAPPEPSENESKDAEATGREPSEPESLMSEVEALGDEPSDGADPPPEAEAPAEPDPPPEAEVPAEPEPSASAPAPVAPDAEPPAAAPVTTEPLDVEEPAPESKKKKHDVDVGLRIVAGLRVRATHPSADQPDPAQTSTRFRLRQTRVKISARYKELLRARASFDLADFLGTVTPGEVLRDAWGNVRFHPAAQLRVGHFKRPYSRLELRGVSKIPFIGRGLFNELAIEDLGWGDRALGAALWGELEPERPGLHRVHWSASVSNHAFSGAPEGVDVHARGTYDPITWLSIAAGGGYKHVEDPLGATRQVFAVSGDVTAQWRGLYASVEVDAAQDWSFADESPWALAGLAYVSYEQPVTKHLRVQPTVAAEYLDANLSYAQSEALRLAFSCNLLWRKYLRVLPQVELVRPRAPVTSVNPAVASETYGLWLSFQL